jgi:DNA (cytosine-5)-methyltransferase 1
MENVPGMKAGGHASLLSRLIEEFEREGYVVPPPKVLNAAEYGVAQDRRRLVLMGSRSDQEVAIHPEPRARPVPKTPHARPRAYGDRLPLGPTVRDVIGDIPDLDRFEQLWHADEVPLSDAQCARARAEASPAARLLRGEVIDCLDFSYKRAFDPALLTSSTRTRHTDASIARFANTAPGTTESVSRFFRLHPEGLSNTLRAGTGSERGAHTSPRPLHPWYPRVISVREAARLHSLSDWFRLHATKWHGFRQIGNAVAPLVGRAVGEELVRALALTSARPTETLDLGSTSLLRMTMAQAAAHFGASADAIPAQRIRRILEPAGA